MAQPPENISFSKYHRIEQEQKWQEAPPMESASCLRFFLGPFMGTPKEVHIIYYAHPSCSITKRLGHEAQPSESIRFAKYCRWCCKAFSRHKKQILHLGRTSGVEQAGSAVFLHQQLLLFRESVSTTSVNL